MYGQHARTVPAVYVGVDSGKTKLEENNIFIDPRISFTEIDRYFFTGCACAFFQIAVDTYTDLSYNPEEWLTQDPTI